MGIYRIYKGVDNWSHIEELPLHDSFWRSVKTSSTMFFKEFTPGTFLDWHPAPRRQIVIILSGRLEHGFRDGSRHTFRAGDVRVLTDTSGEGHTTRVLGDKAELAAVILLAGCDASGSGAWDLICISLYIVYCLIDCD